MCRTLIAASLAAFFLVGQAASAQPGLSYDYLDLSYVDLDFDDIDFDMDGFAVSGSMSFTNEWFGTLGYLDFSGSERFNGESFKIDIDRLDLRVGYRHGIDANLERPDQHGPALGDAADVRMGLVGQRRRGNISATAEALYVHPNTLRQRLRRIMELSGLDLRKDDWLMVEIAVKMVKLEQALGTASTDITHP
jgi:hypothetical protein